MQMRASRRTACWLTTPTRFLPFNNHGVLALSLLSCCPTGGQADLQDDAAQHSASPADSHSVLSRPHVARHFPEQHQMSNAAPTTQQDMYAAPLTSEHQQASLPHQLPSTTSLDRLPSEDVQADASHDFPSQHRVRNAAPDSQQPMFAEPLASHTHDAGFTHSQGPAARAPSSDSSCSGGHDSNERGSVSRHHVSNQTPGGAHAYAQPLTSELQQEQPQALLRDSSVSSQDSTPRHVVATSLKDQDHPFAQPQTSELQEQQPETALRELSLSSPDSAPQQVSSSAPDEEHLHAQQSNEPQAAEQRESSLTSSDSALEHAMSTSAPDDEHPSAQPLGSSQQQDEAEARQHGSNPRTENVTSQHQLGADRHDDSPADRSQHASEQHMQPVDSSLQRAESSHSSLASAERTHLGFSEEHGPGTEAPVTLQQPSQAQASQEGSVSEGQPGSQDEEGEQGSSHQPHQQHLSLTGGSLCCERPVVFC